MFSFHTGQQLFDIYPDVPNFLTMYNRMEDHFTVPLRSWIGRQGSSSMSYVFIPNRQDFSETLPDHGPLEVVYRSRLKRSLEQASKLIVVETQIFPQSIVVFNHYQISIKRFVETKPPAFPTQLKSPSTLRQSAC